MIIKGPDSQNFLNDFFQNELEVDFDLLRFLSSYTLFVIFLLYTINFSTCDNDTYTCFTAFKLNDPEF
jgi:hypothetical protein